MIETPSNKILLCLMFCWMDLYFGMDMPCRDTIRYDGDVNVGRGNDNNEMDFFARIDI